MNIDRKVGTLALLASLGSTALSGIGCGVADAPVAASPEKLVESQKARAESLKGEASALGAEATTKKPFRPR
jgi:hypothetical protein